jgi:hypothetical protein
VCKQVYGSPGGRGVTDKLSSLNSVRQMNRPVALHGASSVVALQFTFLLAYPAQ